MLERRNAQSKTLLSGHGRSTDSRVSGRPRSGPGCMQTDLLHLSPCFHTALPPVAPLAPSSELESAVKPDLITPSCSQNCTSKTSSTVSSCGLTCCVRTATPGHSAERCHCYVLTACRYMHLPFCHTSSSHNWQGSCTFASKLDAKQLSLMAAMLICNS